MSVVVVVGGQWGDEGKGKIVDLLSERASIVARCQGGNNAGHTVKNELGEFRLHLVPSGMFYPTTKCVIGNGVVIDPSVLLNEIDTLSSRGVQVSGRLFVSNRAHVIMPYHIALDGLEEAARGAQSIGTTRRGIGPVYADKVARVGIRIGDLLDEDVLRQKLSFSVGLKNKIITRVYDGEALDAEAIHRQCVEFGKRLAEYVAETTVMVGEAVARGDNVLLEGAQGTLLDVDCGTYPYVTSSSPTAAGACVGVGIGPKCIDRALGVFKVYVTRVGRGPFPTELRDHIGDEIRERAQEYGTTTGRPRRIGWFDAVAGRFSARVNGLDGVCLTRLDVLDPLKSIKVCVGYRLDGKIVDYVPGGPSEYERCEPIFEELPGWQRPTSDVRSYDGLPAEARRFVTRIAELLECRLAMVSVGPRRDQTVVLERVFE